MKLANPEAHLEMSEDDNDTVPESILNKRRARSDSIIALTDIGTTHRKFIRVMFLNKQVYVLFTQQNSKIK